MGNCEKTKLSAIVGVIVALVILIGGCTCEVTPNSEASLNGEGVENKPETLKEESDSTALKLEFAFRAKKTTIEEASKIIGVIIPVPNYLPKGYEVQEVYNGTSDNVVILLISDGPIEKKTIEFTDENENYPGYEVKCEMVLYIFFDDKAFPKIESTTPGVNVRINENWGVIEEQEDGDVIWWSLSAEPLSINSIEIEYVTFMLGATKNITREELLKISESVN